MQRPVLRPESPPQRHHLSNGAVLLTRALPEVYGIGVAVVVRTGTRDEPEHLNGVCHLLEHMVFKGTPTRSAFELSRDMEALGGQLDAYTTKEHTAYTLKILPQQLEPALEIMADMLTRSVFPKDQLDLEKQVVIEEILSARDTPDDYVHELFNEKLWPGHPLHKPILGTEETVRGIDRDALADWCAMTHRAGNLVLAAAGAIGEAELEMIQRAFDFEPGTFEPSPPVAAAPQPQCTSECAEGLSQQYVEIGVPALDVHSEDRYALSVLSSLLGGGMSSRLFQKVREESGLAYSIFSYTDFHRDTGLLATSFSSSPENCGRALEVIAEEYRRLRAGEMGEEEIESNRAQLISSVVLGMEGVLSQTLRLARSEIAFGRFVPVREIVDRVEAVTRDDLVRLAERFLDPALQTVVGYGPLEDLDWKTR